MTLNPIAVAMIFAFLIVLGRTSRNPFIQFAAHGTKIAFALWIAGGIYVTVTELLVQSVS